MVVFLNRRSAFVVLITFYPLLVALWYFGYDVLNLTSDIIRLLGFILIGIDKFRNYSRNITLGATLYSLYFIALYCGSVLLFLHYRDGLTSFERKFFGATVFQNRVSEIFRFGLVFPLYYKYLLEWVKSPFLTAGLITLGLAVYFYKYVILQGLISWI